MQITVMLRVALHCEACVDTVRRAVVRIPGVISSTVDFMAQKVTVVGNVTREEVFKRVSRTGKQTTFWPEEPKEEKEEKKEEKEEEKKEEKKEEETKEKTKEEPEKEESKDEKKEEAAAAKEENKDKATTQVEERKEPFLVFEELYPVSFALRPDYTSLSISARFCQQNKRATVSILWKKCISKQTT
jgi:copper chaperone CopZ